MKRILITIIGGLLMVCAVSGQTPEPQPTQATPVDITQPQVQVPQQQVPGLTPTTTGMILEPKKEGSIRIGVVAIKTQLKQDATGQDMAEVIRTRWYSFLGGPTTEIIPLDARIPVQANLEAAKKECDYILYSAVSQKAKGSFLGGFIKVAVPVLANAVPVGVPGGSGMAQSTGQTISNSVQEGAKDAAKNMATSAASKIKASDQVTLDYVFVKVNSTESPLTKSLKAKAKADGEDIISPLIEQAATQILGVAIKG